MALVWGSCIIFVSSPFAVRRRRTRRTTRQCARHRSVCLSFWALSGCLPSPSFGNEAIRREGWVVDLCWLSAQNDTRLIFVYITLSSPFAVRRRRTRRTTRQCARHQSVCVLFSGLRLGAYLVQVLKTRPFDARQGLLMSRKLLYG